MFKYIQLALFCALIWLYMQTTFLLIINIFYFTIPWLIWGAIVLFLFLNFYLRVPPPSKSEVEKVLGVDPLSFISGETGMIDTSLVSDDQFCMRVIAHRGAYYDYPENSMMAFRGSKEKNVDGIEFDVMLTKDKVPIVFHDPSIERLTGKTGKVEDMTWEELQKYDISAKHPLKNQFGNEERIALFEEVIEESLKTGLRMFIDIKGNGNEMINVILKTFKKYPDLYEKAAISSFNPITIYMIRKKNPRIVGGLAWRPQHLTFANYNRILGPNKLRISNIFHNIYSLSLDFIHDWALERLTYYILGLSFIILHRDLVSSDGVRLWMQKGVRILCWPVNLPTEKAYFSRNLRVTYLTDTLVS